MTKTTPAATAAGETWGKATYRVERSVDLTDAPDIHAKGNAYSPYAIRFDFRRTDGTGWGSLITIYCVKRLPGGAKSIRGGCLYPRQLDEVPSWLDDIITRATPREAHP